ncbi:MFS general substrate transporter [Ceraceosorus guamensis]|uniref:MFS general substrate transporter n=1 Tax=Ceraceosorus guamensis TaxID=1522189 RepID=A0A316VZA3_9BASI|nr:MFS general substrate transporter [Ceraceosorus guamensis]PWN42792.1 MFS general substrate transporter [Ceraceosorus guamensis]
MSAKLRLPRYKPNRQKEALEHEVDLGEHAVALASSADQKPKPFFKRLYYNPRTQILILGLVLFLCPGLFNAATSIGGAGLANPRVASDSLTSLYAVFALSGLVGGVINNKLGVRLTLCLGATGYSLYMAALLVYAVRGDDTAPFTITAGAILGASAGLLWTAYGTLVLSLPTESEKGRFFGLAWACFNAGDIIGSLVLVVETADSKETHLSVAGYAVLLGLTVAGVALPWALLPPIKVTRTDGTRVISPRFPSLRSELVGMYKCLRYDPLILLMVPWWFFSNSFYVYHFNSFNLGNFSIRSRALNSLLYWLAQSIAAPLFGQLLDLQRVSRPTRAKIGVAVVGSLTMLVWAASYHVQHSFSRESPRALDYKDTDDRVYYLGLQVLYILFGVADSCWQSFAYYSIGSMSNNSRKLSYMSGLYKAFQSSGNAVFWRLDSRGIPYMRLLIITWASLAGSLVIALPMILVRITDFTTTSVRIVETEAEVLEATSYSSLAGDSASQATAKRI